ncbi:MAG: Uncharacterised protein [SAR116 cluster bacterium]|nr:MAG: Uncharacterised protein [SAR116 cluster bacterium]
MAKHPLRCPRCSDFRTLQIDGVRFEKDNKSVGIKVPFFRCYNCGKKDPLRPQEFYQEIADKRLDELKDGEFASITFKYENEKFERFDHLGFKYSPEDYFLIPGLYREFDQGYLCPVFFDKDLLLYYNNHPDYSVKFYSFSSGNIYHNGETMFSWGFGINRNGKIFKWLGDLNDDFEDPKMEKHLKRFQASNVESDHDIYSKFYLSQNPFSTEDAFQDSDNEVKIFSLKDELDKLFKESFGFSLTKVEIVDLFDFYKPPILEENEQIFNAYISLNKLLIENIQVANLKNKLNENGADRKKVKSLGSIKTLEAFILDILKLKNSSELISPIYVLSDLRQLQGHFSDSSFEEKYSFCKDRLGLDKDCSHFDVYQTLIEKLVEFFEILIKEIKPAGNNV